MDNKTRLVILIFIILITLLTFFTLAGAAKRSDGDLLAYLPVILKINATPITNHFDDCAFRTGNNATAAVPANVTINGDLILAINDEIAIYTPDGSICAGMTLWSGENIAIAAWGDDNQTDEVDGLRSGEKMSFRIWDKSENKEIQVKEVAYSLGDGIYVPDGIFAVSAFTLN